MCLGKRHICNIHMQRRKPRDLLQSPPSHVELVFAKSTSWKSILSEARGPTHRAGDSMGRPFGRAASIHQIQARAS